MIFTRLDLLWIIVSLTILILLLRWGRKRNYFTHPLLFYLHRRIRPASPIVYLPEWLEVLALVFAGVALLNPVLPSAEHLVVNEGLDIILALDLSSSMQEPMDSRGAFQRRRLGIAREEKTRLDAVKEAMVRFLQKRHSDRIGIVVFSENGYVVAPMTKDTSYLTQYLRMVDGKTLASEGQTAIGEGILTALNLAAQQIRDRRGRQGQLMIVLTDGENNTGRDVYMAIREAREAGFRIHFIGVEVDKAPNAPRLIAAVRATGGNYYDVRDAQQLDQVYLDISRLEKGIFFTQKQAHQVPHYYPFAMTSFLLLAASLALRAVPYFIEIS